MKVDDKKKYSLDSCVIFVKETIDARIMDYDDRGITADKYKERKSKIELLSMFIKNCGVGDIAAKEYVKDYILDILTQEYDLNESNIDYVISFNQPNSLTYQDMFDILLQTYKSHYQYNGSAMKQFVIKYKFNELRDYKGKRMFVVTGEDIKRAYILENISLSFEDKLDIVVQRIYSLYKGLGVIDDILDQSINGLSIGVSGIPESYASFTDLNDYINKVNVDAKKSYDSVWLYYNRKEIYLEFMSFGSYEELDRVINTAYKYNLPGQLSKSNPAIINSMANGGRGTYFIYPFSEANIMIIRKFPEHGTLDEQIKGKNADIIYKIVKFIAETCVSIITGDQGIGKTTFEIAALRETYPFETIRMYEGAFEAHFKRLEQERNSITFTSTDEINGDKALALIRKANGTITVIQEAAEDIDVAYFFKVAMFAKSTMMGHHANSFSNLIKFTRNSAVNAGSFINESLAEEQIISILDYNIHLGGSLEDEEFYIERISECLPYPDKEKGTDYTERIIAEYDEDNKAYLIRNLLHDEKVKKMKKKLLKEDRPKLDELLLEMKKLIS